MTISKTLQNFLDKNKIKYEIIEHKIVYTAHDRAATLHVKPEMVGKTMVLKCDNDYFLALIPANRNLDKKKFLKVANNWLQKQGQNNSDGRVRITEARRAKVRYSHADFAKESWMKKTFKGIDVGATPPFGLMYNLPFFIDNSLVKQSKIFVNGGKYNLSIKISPANLLKLNPQAIKGEFSQAKK